MKNFGVYLSILLSLALLSNALTTREHKEHKKKLLEKLRAALTTETESGTASETVASALPTSEDIDKVDEVEAGVVQDEVGVEPALDSVETVTNTYLIRFRNILKRVLEVLGLRRRKDGRQSRLLSYENNNLDNHIPIYKDEVRTTVGAVLGQKECIQKVACVSGTYLKGVKGRQLIFALLDVFSPTSWKETVKIAKQSAIFNETCDYKCLEE